jgi:hypothetical protein
MNDISLAAAPCVSLLAAGSKLSVDNNMEEESKVWLTNFFPPSERAPRCAMQWKWAARAGRSTTQQEPVQSRVRLC